MDGPTTRPTDVALSSGTLRQVVAALQEGRPPPAEVEVVDGDVRVEILHEAESREARRIIEEAGGVVEGVASGIVQALVPFERLEALEAQPIIQHIRVPLRVDIDP